MCCEGTQQAVELLSCSAAEAFDNKPVKDRAQFRREMLSVLGRCPGLFSLSGCSSCCRAHKVSEELFSVLGGV